MDEDNEEPADEQEAEAEHEQEAIGYHDVEEYQAPEQAPDEEEEENPSGDRVDLPPVERPYRTTRQGSQFTQPKNGKDTLEYDSDEAIVLAVILCQLRDRFQARSIQHGNQFVTTYSLQKGVKKFGDRGKNAALKEMKQLHDRECFRPIHKRQLTAIELKRAMESLIFLVEKRDASIKARHCANGSTQREYMSREEVSSPTVSTESTLLTAVIEAEEGRDVGTCDIPNAFVQTEVSERDHEGNRTIMKIRGILVDILCEMDPVYKDYVVYEGKDKKQKVLYVHIVRALYGMLVSAMLFYKKFVADITKYGFELNPYDPCVANKMVNGKQMTISWHVDDVKASHKESKILDGFFQWVKDTYGSIGEVKITRGKIHEYLGMTLDYSVPGQVSINMIDYVKSMIANFPEEYLQGSKVASPWNENLFKVDDKSPALSDEMREQFHTSTAQGLFACKRARPDISPAIANLTTRVRTPNQDDWNKLVRMMKFLKQTQSDVLTLRADGSKTLKWHVDAAFAVHPDFRSHTGATMTMGKGAITSISRKQGMNTRSSTEAEVVAADEAVGPMLWTRRFLEHQGYEIKDNILFQDNQSAMLLESNGRKSAGKRSRHLNIRFFFVADQKAKGHIDIRFCPTDQMVGDYMTKPLHGSKFKEFRRTIMNMPSLASQLMMIGCCTRKPGESMVQAQQFLLVR